MESYIHDRDEALDSSQANMIRATAERFDFICLIYFLYDASQPVLLNVEKGNL